MTYDCETNIRWFTFAFHKGPSIFVGGDIVTIFVLSDSIVPAVQNFMIHFLFLTQKSTKYRRNSNFGRSA